MEHISSAESGYGRSHKATREQVFLAEMEKVVPGDRLCTIRDQYCTDDQASSLSLRETRAAH